MLEVVVHSLIKSQSTTELWKKGRFIKIAPEDKQNETSKEVLCKVGENLTCEVGCNLR